MENNNSDSYLDLIFESKNKRYGAYQLRRRKLLYESIAFVASTVLIVGLCSMGKWLIQKSSEPASPETIRMQHRKVVGYSQLTAPPPIEAVPTPSPPGEADRSKTGKPAAPATKKFLPPVVRSDAEVEQVEPIPTQQELKKVNPGKQTVEGDSLGAVDLSEYDEAVIELDIDMTTQPDSGEVPAEAPPSPSPVVQEEIPPEEETEKIFVAVEQQPSFPGGDDALLQYLHEHVKYPRVAHENGIEGIVLIKMVIEADGSISNIEIMRDIGGGCAEEVIRVVKGMPRWEPGVQAGTKVRVSVVLPVEFELTEEW